MFLYSCVFTSNFYNLTTREKKPRTSSRPRKATEMINTLAGKNKGTMEKRALLDTKVPRKPMTKKPLPSYLMARIRNHIPPKPANANPVKIRAIHQRIGGIEALKRLR